VATERYWKNVLSLLYFLSICWVSASSFRSQLVVNTPKERKISMSDTQAGSRSGTRGCSTPNAHRLASNSASTTPNSNHDRLPRAQSATTAVTTTVGCLVLHKAMTTNGSSPVPYTTRRLRRHYSPQRLFMHPHPTHVSLLILVQVRRSDFPFLRPC